ncbi:MAG TPA: aspartate--ammonia ligase [Thermoanaerobaculia bacterium]|nr:aspartate--ammonia ligase [Thermoanaerobaculia bacterium]
MSTNKVADLAGPGIGTYEEIERVLPAGYRSLLDPQQTQKALFALKRFIVDNLNRELNLFTVEVPLIVSRQSGINDYLDRDGSRTPVEFPCGLGLERRIDAQVVQAATKWKRMALAQFGCKVGEGINTDMRAVRKDYFLDHDHSAYVDQWDWEKVITAEQRNLATLEETVRKIWKVIYQAELFIQTEFPALRDPRYPSLPEELVFLHAEDLLEMYPDLPRKERETRYLQERHPAVFILGIGWVLADGYPHEMRAADYDDWVTPTRSEDGRPMHGLNGDILVWNPVTRRRHELSSMGIRVTKETLRQQLELSGQLHFLDLPYHQAVLNDRIPLSIGGGIGQSRTTMLLLRKAHLGEVSVSVWPDRLRKICEAKNIHVLE